MIHPIKMIEACRDHLSGARMMEGITNINRILFDAKQHYFEKNPTAKEFATPDNEFSDELDEVAELKRIVSEANRYVVGVNAEFSIETHEGTNRTIVRMLDIETHAVIKEFPPSEMLDVIAGIWEQAGILVDRRE